MGSFQLCENAEYVLCGNSGSGDVLPMSCQEWCEGTDFAPGLTTAEPFEYCVPQVRHAVAMFHVAKWLLLDPSLAVRSLVLAYTQMCNSYTERPLRVVQYSHNNGVMQGMSTAGSGTQHFQIVTSVLLCNSTYLANSAQWGPEQYMDWSPPNPRPIKHLRQLYMEPMSVGNVVASVQESNFDRYETWGFFERPSRDLCWEYCQCMRIFLQPYLTQGLRHTKAEEYWRPHTMVHKPRSHKLRQLLPKPVVQQMEDIVTYFRRRWAMSLAWGDIRRRVAADIREIEHERYDFAMQKVASREDVRCALTAFDLAKIAGYLTPQIEPRSIETRFATVEVPGLNGDTLEQQRVRTKESQAKAAAEAAAVHSAAVQAMARVRLAVPNIPRST